MTQTGEPAQKLPSWQSAEWAKRADEVSVKPSLPNVFEGWLCWPDTGLRPFEVKKSLDDGNEDYVTTRVRLYPRKALKNLVKKCRDKERPVTFHDVEVSGGAPAGETTTTHGYFRFENVSTGDYYLAVEGCAVVLPLWATDEAALNDGKPARKRSKRAQYLIDAGNFGCLLELKHEITARQVHVWHTEVAYVRGKIKNGVLQTIKVFAQYRDVLISQVEGVLRQEWWASVRRKPPHDKTERSVYAVTVVPLAVLASPDVAQARRAQDKTRDNFWTCHPEIEVRITDSIHSVFNPPEEDAPQLRDGLNVDYEGRPRGRKRIVPRAFLDLREAPDRAAILRNVHVKFFDFGLRWKTTEISLRSFAVNADAEQVPFGDAECWSEDPRTGEYSSRIRVFTSGPSRVISPILPHYTQHVEGGEHKYHPLKYISGGYWKKESEETVEPSGEVVAYMLPKRHIHPPGTPVHHPHPAICKEVASHSPGHPDSGDDEVFRMRCFREQRKLLYYHDDYFRVGKTDGVFYTYRDVAADHKHRGLDLHNFCLSEPGHSDSTPDTKAEALYAMARGGVEPPGQVFDGSWYELTMVKFGDSDNPGEFSSGKPDRLSYVHCNTGGMGAAVRGRATNAKAIMVWAGTYLGWSGVSGSGAASSDTKSKHLHLYYYRNNSKQDPSLLFGAQRTCGTETTGVTNQYPLLKGRIVNEQQRPFPVGHVKVIAYDANKASPLTQDEKADARIFAIAPCNAGGNFVLDIPVGVMVKLIATRAYCVGFEDKAKTDYNDVPIEELGTGDSGFTVKPGFNKTLEREVMLKFRQRVRLDFSKESHDSPWRKAYGDVLRKANVRIWEGGDSEVLISTAATDDNGDFEVAVPLGELYISFFNETWGAEVTVPTDPDVDVRLIDLGKLKVF